MATSMQAECCARTHAQCSRSHMSGPRQLSWTSNQTPRNPLTSLDPGDVSSECEQKLNARMLIDSTYCSRKGPWGQGSTLVLPPKGSGEPETVGDGRGS